MSLIRDGQHKLLLFLLEDEDVQSATLYCGTLRLILAQYIIPQ
jgi:hypothetical protein